MKAKLFFFFFLNWIMFYHGYQNKRILYTDISVFQLIRSLICRCHCIISFGLALYLFCTFFQIEFKI